MTPSTQNKSLFSIILVGLIGNVMEWYDFAVYGYFAGILGQHFFPASDPAVSLIASFGAFAAGFLMRPLGGILFGRIGDALGRQTAMSLSVLAMAVPTVLMALLPTYDQIGIGAPILLVLLRITQGLSVGGEYTSSLIYLAENGPSHRKALTAIWGNWGAVLGMLLGSAVGLATATWLGSELLEQWGWRIPFAIGGMVALVGWWIRRKLPADVPASPPQNPVREVLTRYRPHLLRIILVNIGFGVAYYTVFVYAVTYIRNIDHFSEALALELNTLSMGVLLIALPLAAWMADQIGHRRMVSYSLILLVALAIPLFSAIHSEVPHQVLIAEMIFAVLVAFTSGGMVALNVQLLPDYIRCTGLALAYNIAHGLFGGTTPLIAAWLLKTSDNPIAPAYWLMVALGLSTLTVVLWIRDRHLHPVGDKVKS
jgi:MHS family proline/betaine transporter-like MFS transporter